LRDVFRDVFRDPLLAFRDCLRVDFFRGERLLRVDLLRVDLLRVDL
jgi:hypothetical protein